MFTLDDLDYHLPEELIAQHPPERRDAARLLAVDRATGHIEDRLFTDLPELLRAGDVLVLNDTKVIPGRLLAEKVTTGARIEVLLLEECAPSEWEVLVRPGRRVSAGTILRFADMPVPVEGRITGVGDGGIRRIHFNGEHDMRQLVWEIGSMPLPPYIKRPHPLPEDRTRYQTLFAREPGAIAAPTAGLHFTPEMFEALKQRGVQRVFVTLHVGLGTFQPLSEEHIASGRLHEERFWFDPGTARALNAAKRDGRRVIAVGSTSVRVLETVYAAGEVEPFRPQAGRTALFLKPGDAFQAVDAIVTNFHLPRSSLFALVCAFAGTDLMKRAYKHAVADRYRFYSYGDATFLC